MVGGCRDCLGELGGSHRLCDEWYLFWKLAIKRAPGGRNHNDVDVRPETINVIGEHHTIAGAGHVDVGNQSYHKVAALLEEGKSFRGTCGFTGLKAAILYDGGELQSGKRFVIYNQEGLGRETNMGVHPASNEPLHWQLQAKLMM